jgi:hypothetical protein
MKKFGGKEMGTIYRVKLSLNPNSSFHQLAKKIKLVFSSLRFWTQLTILIPIFYINPFMHLLISPLASILFRVNLHSLVNF